MKKHWLRNQIEVLIRNNHPELFKYEKSWVVSQLLAFVSYKQGVLIVPFVLTIFLTTFLLGDISVFFDFGKETAQKLLEERIKNIAGLASLAFVVVGFLITNLSIRDEIGLKLLYRNTYLTQVVIATLTTLGCLIVLSTLKKKLPPPLFDSGVVIGSGLAIIIITLIALLFIRVSFYANRSEVRRLLISDVLRQSCIVHRERLLRLYSSEKYRVEMEDKGAAEYNPYHHLDLQNFTALADNEEEPENRPVYARVIDVNLPEILRKITRKIGEGVGISFSKLTLGETRDVDRDFVHAAEGNLDVLLSREFRKQIDFDYETPVNEPDDNRNYLAKQLERLAKNGESEEVDEYLKAYLELYEIELNESPDFALL